MRYFTIHNAIFAVALLVSLVIFPLKATGLAEHKDPANTAGWLTSAIEKKVEMELSGPGRTVESIRVSLPARFSAPDKYDSLDITIPNQNRLGNRVFVSVTFRKNGNILARTNATALVKVMVDLVIAERNLDRGAIIGRDDIRVETRAMGAGFRNVVTDVSGVVGKQIDRNIRAGTPLLNNIVSKPKLVRAGDMVTILAQSGRLMVTASGRAKQSGDRGEWIPVINMGSKKIIQALVTGSGKVRVEF